MSEAKAFFDGCRRIEHRISALVDERERVRDLAYHTTTVYSDVPHGNGGTPQSKTERAVMRLVDLEHEIDAVIDEMVERRRIAQEIIAELTDDRQRDVLTWRYFACWSWDKIADRIGKERMQVWRIHGRALLEVQNMLIRKLADVAI